MKNRYGKVGTLLSSAALIAALSADYSKNALRDSYGVITEYLSWFLLLFREPARFQEGHYAVSPFALHEENLILLLTFSVILLVILAIVCACLAARYREDSFGYAVIVCITSATVSMVNQVGGLVFILLFGGLVYWIKVAAVTPSIIQNLPTEPSSADKS